VAGQELHKKRQPTKDEEEEMQFKLNHVQFELKLKLLQMGLTDSAAGLFTGKEKRKNFQVKPL